MIPTILKARQDGEYQDYLDQTYETIDHDKHEKEVINNER